ncbi:hypothetical protein FVE67_06830 [Thermosulfurimonas marina]|uniref:Prenyltransferase alpha-alpha toroid domain-containing protein n=1 Tax=Thermosulfurimonas marina TaxID=2047767 RepID=A0A6H1WUX1_9BACT|nr:prenyltransferase/squalene oxidase repeat-containing protein [Thermosulfurimonas marina]QJA06997.1 hypothetical protein FVE67_06830 [Thermosulfurimonas marina]
MKKEILKFVREREKVEGGFGATPRLPATVEDTYFAVRTLEELSALTPRTLSGVRAFLEKNLPGRTTQPPVLRRWLWLARRVGLKPPEKLKDLLSGFLRRIPPRRGKPEVLSALYESALLLGLPAPEGLRKAACALRPRTLFDLYHLARVAPELLTEERLRWVLAARNPDGGFGFFPRTTSFLENTYFAVRLLTRGGRDLPQPERTRLFVERCFRKGGFARAPGGIPFLETTCYGVYLLRRLGGEI